MQKITHAKDGSEIEIIVELVTVEDYKKITKSRYYFDWRKEKAFRVYKLTTVYSSEILGLMSLKDYQEEQRFQINLLTVSKENRGKNKTYEKIAGNLIAYACREAVKSYGEDACVSLHPKTELKKHYMEKYGMSDASLQVFLEGTNLLRLLEKNRI